MPCSWFVNALSAVSYDSSINFASLQRNGTYCTFVSYSEASWQDQVMQKEKERPGSGCFVCVF